jgi:lysophospholipase L1-like esterase
MLRASQLCAILSGGAWREFCEEAIMSSFVHNRVGSRGTAAALAAALTALAARADVTIFVPPSAHFVEHAAAQDLVSCLGRIYPREKFAITNVLPKDGSFILLGRLDPGETFTVAGKPPKDGQGGVIDRVLNAGLGTGRPSSAPKPAESFMLISPKPGAKEILAIDGAREIGVIAGADARGTARGVYALLEKLGCGFYLSGDALPPPRETAFSFDGCNLTDHPIVHDRIVFDWHNFLSGCSTWNLPEWQSWIRQSQKMGYNGIMVHAYGNNPMVSFTFNGKTKPVGYLSTTARGRDWSTMHVNDVRRLFGGGVFNGPVFGADAAQGPEDQRAGAAQQLMQGVFAHAGRRAMNVYFADDVDTISANPQDLILTLPEDARFSIQTQTVNWMGQEAGRLWLANPDTPEGYRYYKAQAEALLKAYPQITTLVVWFRQGGTPWMEVKVAEMPPAWQKEYETEIARTPEAAKLWHAPQMFAIGKIVRAFDRALKENGSGAQVAAGTWDFTFLAPCHRFFPPGVKLIGLDYNALHGRPQLGDDESRRVIRDVAAHRPVVPVIWAHHDDGNYLGRSYTPFPQFAAKLADARACGFGIIHWTTRPLDLYFKSHIEQVWSTTKDRPLRETCDDMAARSFGAAAQPAMGGYLERWVSDAPIFSRETSDRFIDRQLTNIVEVVTGCRERMKQIETVDATKLTQEQRDRLNYFKGLEEFIAAIFETHGRFQDAQAALKKGDLAAARTAMAGCRPEPVIEQYAKFSSLCGMTRGERGTVVSLNTRWLPHLVRLRQQLGLEPVRYHFGPTSHDPLAQAPGRFTFHFDAEHHLWQTLGTQETGAETFTLPAEAAVANEICRGGIESDKPVSLSLAPILSDRKNAAAVPAGNYRLRLLMLDPTSTAAGQRVFSVALGVAGDPAMERCDFDPVKAHFLRLACHGNSQNDWNSIEEVALDSLAKDKAGPVAMASHEMKDYPAPAAVDGKRETRWATRGRDEWIQFRLDPGVATDHIGIAWFGGNNRKARFEILVSDDGQQWKPVEHPQPASSAIRTTESGRMDIFAETGGRGRVLERAFDVKLPAAGRVTVTLTPVTGKALICGAALEPAAAQFSAAPLCPASLVSEGNLARLQRALARARRGETTTVAVIGGSITQGAKASKPENRYGNHIAAWWREKFPKTKIEFVNAGIGATGTNYGALRARRDLLSHQPDFVVVEYSVNDPALPPSAETMEGLLRQILRQPNQPAALLLFMMRKDGGNTQAWHGKVGKHYALPMVSFRDALWPEIQAGRLPWETLIADQVHPNDAGHACAAMFVTSLLEKVLKELPPDDRLAAVAPVPAPLFTDLFEHTALFEAGDLQPRKNDGWTLDQKIHGWRSDKPGSVIEFEIEGRTIYAMHYVVRKAMGKAKAQVDAGEPVTLNGWFDQTWGGYRCSTVLARDLKPGPHRVRVELLEDKSPASEGHEFHLLGLGAAGVP